MVGSLIKLTKMSGVVGRRGLKLNCTHLTLVDLQYPTTAGMPSDDIDWELAEGVPQFENPFIQKYLQGRHALIEEEHKQRHGQLQRTTRALV